MTQIKWKSGCFSPAEHTHFRGTVFIWIFLSSWVAPQTLGPSPSLTSSPAKKTCRAPLYQLHHPHQKIQQLRKWRSSLEGSRNKKGTKEGRDQQRARNKIWRLDSSTREKVNQALGHGLPGAEQLLDSQVSTDPLQKTILNSQHKEITRFLSN